VSQFLDPVGTIETMSLLRAITTAIKDEFVYTRRSEKGIQSPHETLQRRRGSCEIFAVLMMEATRSLGLAARFVSGYLFVPMWTLAAPYEQCNACVDASYLPGAGGSILIRPIASSVTATLFVSPSPGIPAGVAVVGTYRLRLLRPRHGVTVTVTEEDRAAAQQTLNNTHQYKTGSGSGRKTKS